jgi:exopolysaccharide biosynthesis protein
MTSLQRSHTLFIRTVALSAASALAAALVTVAAGAAHLPPTDQQASQVTLKAPGYVWTRAASTDGVNVFSGSLARPSVTPVWTVTVFAPAISSLTGLPTTSELGSAGRAHESEQKLQTAGYTVQVATLAWPNYTDTPHGVQGYRVRTGSYGSQADAQGVAVKLKGAGFTTATVQWTGYDSDAPVDAEQVHVAVIDPSELHGTITATHGSAIAQRTTTSQLARQSHAIVAVNGGYFVTSDADGFQGAPSGLAAYQGTLQGMSVGDRAALDLQDNHASIQHLVSTVTLTSGGASAPVDGINRRPGLVRDCGRPQLQPTSQPRQDITCTTGSDTVLFTAQFGAALPTGPGVQAVLDTTGDVLSLGARGGSIPAGGSAVQAIGAPATWLASHLSVGAHTRVLDRVRDDRTGQPLDIHATTGILSAGPTLLHDGHPAIDAATEGVIDPLDPSFNFAWAEIRQPRTMVGTDASGRLLLVTVDGRGPGVSEGLTLVEEARLMRDLGARQAMNLDGGGSTAMVVNGGLVNHPSDSTGERADGDALVIIPG